MKQCKTDQSVTGLFTLCLFIIASRVAEISYYYYESNFTRNVVQTSHQSWKNISNEYLYWVHYKCCYYIKVVWQYMSRIFRRIDLSFMVLLVTSYFKFMYFFFLLCSSKSAFMYSLILLGMQLLVSRCILIFPFINEW